MSQMELIKEYFLEHPNRDIPHAEIVDWATEEHKKRNDGKVFRDPDRAIRKLTSKRILTKNKEGRLSL